jgi:TATA-box binding protein (TBP) (component of TFIID and TFIIIB)
VEVNLDILYDNLYISSESTGITFIEYGKKREETLCKGFAKKFLINRRRERPTKRFDNQLTIAYRVNETTLINIKVFKNGNIQMTGVKNIDQGYTMIDVLINLIKDVHKEDNNVVTDIDNIKNANYKICLINTDFRIGFEIKRDNLFKLLIKDYENIVSYEPCIYPGVKIQYFWNSQNPLMDGVCHCENKCFLKKKSGNGHGESNCKKITISNFQSGAVIITGSQQKEQIDECYKYINDVLYTNVDKIEKKQMV